MSRNKDESSYSEESGNSTAGFGWFALKKVTIWVFIFAGLIWLLVSILDIGGDPKPSASSAEPYKIEVKATPPAKEPDPPATIKEPAFKGTAFVQAVIEPLEYELEERFWGWRVNDVIDITDNVNNFQLGVLEVTRKTAIVLAENISRTGSTDAYDKNLENAMNFFMIKPGRYWFPSAESKYKDGLDELRVYMGKLKRKEAKFHTRTDNLIPLLTAYKNLLGSCDENLVKHKEKDGSDVGFFGSDDYFYYAKGAASAMHTILEAVYKDFYATIEARKGIEVLLEAIKECEHAAHIDPIIITNSSLYGILANHRANMAAPISHARFYIGVLITILST